MNTQKSVFSKSSNKGREKRACKFAGPALFALYTEGETQWQKQKQ